VDQLEEKWGCWCYPIAAVIALVLTPAVVSRLKWSGLIVFVILLLDMVFVLYTPFNLRRARSAVYLHSRGWHFGGSIGTTILMFVVTVIIPVGFLAWLFMG
jgi:hypothetical protein